MGRCDREKKEKREIDSEQESESKRERERGREAAAAALLGTTKSIESRRDFPHFISAWPPSALTKPMDNGQRRASSEWHISISLGPTEFLSGHSRSSCFTCLDTYHRLLPREAA